VIADALHQFAHGDVVRVGRILRHESDMACDALHSELGGEVADLVRPLLAFVAGGARDEAHGLLHRWNIGVALADVRCEHRHQRELRRVQRLLPFGRRGIGESHVARQSKLPAAHARRAYMFQRIPPGPKHHPRLQGSQRLHIIFAPLRVRDSKISRINFTASADSAAGHSSAGLPVSQHSAK
jgi:hypothetical protein